MQSSINKFTNKYICFYKYLMSRWAWNKQQLLEGGVVEKKLSTTDLYDDIMYAHAITRNTNQNAIMQYPLQLMMPFRVKAENKTLRKLHWRVNFLLLWRGSPSRFLKTFAETYNMCFPEEQEVRHLGKHNQDVYKHDVLTKGYFDKLKT